MSKIKKERSYVIDSTSNPDIKYFYATYADYTNVIEQLDDLVEELIIQGFCKKLYVTIDEWGIVYYTPVDVNYKDDNVKFLMKANDQ